jgi:thiamine-monophosphate kinase
MKEFKLIEIAKKILSVDREDVLVGIGDDCALVKVGDTNLVLTTDCLHERTDFPSGIKAEEIGHLALAVNLSDLAGCGANPLFFLYTVTLSKYDEAFFAEMIGGMRKLADRYGVAIVGGDTDFGDELHISGFAIGVAERFIGRDNAKVGDIVCLTGLLGKAQLSLEQLLIGKSRDEIAYPNSLFKPEPRVKEGLEIAKHANAMTDISDSLAISLHQIAESSGVGIEIYEDKLPLNHLTPYVSYEKALELFLYSGGDYELVYTSKLCSHGFAIGKVVEGKGVWLIKRDGSRVKIEFKGYTHSPPECGKQE